MPVHSAAETDGHRARLRTRILEGGIDAMPDYELLELLLGYAIPRGDVKPLAKRLLSAATLGGLVSRDPQDLARLPGLGPHTASLLALVRVLHLRLTTERECRLEFLHDPEQAVPWLRAAIGLSEEERFAAIYLDQGRRILAREVFGPGSRTRTVLYPRQLFQKAFAHKATGVVIAHNHPGGSRAPSHADRELTRVVARLGEGLEVDLVDHLIVTADGHSSMRAQGWL
jgi:DNA repair protein RadC